MDKQVLTLEIAMKYMFAKVINYFDKFTRYENILEFLVEQDYQLICNYQLQLRKLSSLTEEEKQFLMNMSVNFYEILYDLFDFKTADELIIAILEICSFELITAVIDQLRKWNIDIDNLIQSGVAEEVR